MNVYNGIPNKFDFSDAKCGECSMRENSMCLPLKFPCQNIGLATCRGLQRAYNMGVVDCEKVVNKKCDQVKRSTKKGKI